MSPGPGHHRGLRWVRLLGLVLFAALLARLDRAELLASFAGADARLVVLAVAANLPMIWLKTLRWRTLLSAQGIDYGMWNAYLAYWGSIFVGFLTPGRLGEFVKALHVSEDCGVSPSRALPSVLVDRLFDLAVLVLVAGAGFARWNRATAAIAVLLAAAGLLAVAVLGSPPASLRRLVPAAVAKAGWIEELGRGLRSLDWRSLARASALTVLASALYFSQCYALAIALALPVRFGHLASVVALASLVTMIPVSISGLGTREATILAALGAVGVPAEAAMSFSLLVFAVFYLSGGFVGGVAWWWKPARLGLTRPEDRATGRSPYDG